MNPATERERVAASELLRAAHAWLSALPAGLPRIDEALAAAAELRVEINVQPGTRFARIAAHTVDGAGEELVLLGAVDLRPREAANFDA